MTPPQTDPIWQKLKQFVIEPGLCTHCGTCVALSEGSLQMLDGPHGPQPAPLPNRRLRLPPVAWSACPGKGVDYPALNQQIFGTQPPNFLLGQHRQLFVGYAENPAVRRAGASGGVISQVLCHLLNTGRVQGAIVVQQGQPEPWQAQAVIAQSEGEILAASQSVYAPIPVNVVLAHTATFPGHLAYVGLPDQVAALRMLQAQNHPAAQKIRYVLGPYVGTNLYFEAIRSFLRRHGVSDLRQVRRLRYREGEWPGYLSIELQDGRHLTAKKFYYNYLIPFYITQSSRLAVDFSNELTDISVGDAWHPRYEAQGEGFSVVVARSALGENLLAEMEAAGSLSLEALDLETALSMHGHMLDFKKRGSFIRLAGRQVLGLPVPDYGYQPAQIPPSRYAVEAVISGIFALGSTRLARRAVAYVPLGVLGPAFDGARKLWKALSKPTKRQGLMTMTFTHNDDTPPPTRPNTVLNRVRVELEHWLRRTWDFADVGRHWDATEDYDDINAETYSYFRRFTDGYRLSADIFPDQAHVLDFCARTGKGTLYFQQQGKISRAVCADVSLQMGQICRSFLRAEGFSEFTWVPVDDYRLPFETGTFEGVLCFETVEHFPDPAGLVCEIGRVTQPGGVMILTTPNILWEPVHALAAITKLHHSEGPHRFLREKTLREIVTSAGFRIERAETTVLIPGGPTWLVKLGEWLEARTRYSLMPWLGLRRILICRRLGKD